MNFFDVHSGWYIFFLLLFPRISMLAMGVCVAPWAYPVLFWLGWIFAPRFVVAILATTFYWNANPILCILAWGLAFGSIKETEKETKYVAKKVKSYC